MGDEDERHRVGTGQGVCTPVRASPSRQALSWSQSIEMTYDCKTQSQEPSQTQTEVLTQNVELTQLGDEETSTGVLSPLPPYSPSALRNIPWGLLMSCGEGIDRTRWELLPKEVEGRETTSDGAVSRDRGDSTGGVSIMGLHNIQASDIFNVHTLGRSQKVDFIIPRVKPISEEEAKIFKWAHAMTSNQHLRIFCTLNETTGHDISVWIEDTSGNGTMVNQTTILRRGERRLLNSGDEICVINPATLRRKIRSQTKLAQVLQQFSFVFVRQQARQPLGGPMDFSKFSNISPWQPPPSTRKAAVNARATTGRDPTVERFVPKLRRRLEDDYEIRDLIGEGTTGLVRRAIHRRTGEARAVKVIRIQKRPSSSGATASAMVDVQAEAKILQEISHPYIVKLDDFYVTESVVYLVMELMAGGDLFDRIVEKGRYGETESRRVMRRVMTAVHYLHEEQNVVHRDLKPENILLVSRRTDIQVKLTDFGLAKTVNDEGCKTFCGTPQYFAPEVFRRQHTVMGRGRYGKPADMWSLGVILYVLLSGTQPFEYGHVLDFPEADWNHVSTSAKDLVRRLLEPEASRRLTISQACKHQWILTEDGDTHTNPLHDPVILSADRVADAHGVRSSKETLDLVGSQRLCSVAEAPVPASSGNLEERTSPESLEKSIPVFTSPDVLPLEKLEDMPNHEVSNETEGPMPGAGMAIQSRPVGKSARVSDETEARRPLSPTSFNAVFSRVPPKHPGDAIDTNEEIESSFDDAEDSIASFATTEEETQALIVAGKREFAAAAPTEPLGPKPKRPRRRGRRTSQSKGDSLATLIQDERQTTLSSWIKTPRGGGTSNASRHTKKAK